MALESVDAWFYKKGAFFIWSGKMSPIFAVTTDRDHQKRGKDQANLEVFK